MILKDKIPFSIVVPMHGGLNVKDDPTEIGDTELQVAERVSFDNKVAEKASGVEKINPTALEGGAQIDGVWRSYADDGTARLIGVCNGKIYESSDWTNAIHTGMTAGKRCTFVDYQGKTIISNGYDDPVLYNPKTNAVEGAIGIQGPRQIKQIAYFESDETWTGTGVAADTEAYRLDEYSGDSIRALKITAGASTTKTAERTVTLDGTKFDDDETIGTWDFIQICVYHRLRANIGTITLTFETSAGNHYAFSFDEDELDKDEQRDYQWTTLKLRKNRFTATGSPDWSTITKLKIAVTAEASGTAAITFDNWHFRRTPPIAGIFKKPIATFEANDETWSDGAADTVYGHFVEGSMGLKLTDGHESAYCDKSLDLTRWITGQDLSTSDDFKIWAFINDSTKITSVTIKLGDADLANHYYKTWATFLVGTNLWNELTVAKADFTGVGAPDWSAIARIQVEAVLAAGGECTFDWWHVVEKSGAKQISEVEYGTAGETWTGGYWGTTYRRRGSYTRESMCHAYDTLEQVDVVFDTPKDLTQWDDTTASTTDDFIAFFHKYWTAYAGTWVATKVIIDCNAGDFATDYFILDAVTPSYLTLPGRYKDGYVHIRKRDFARVGTTAGKGWDTVKGIRFVIFTGGYFYWVGQVWVAIDDIMLRRKTGLDGRYRWKAVYKSATMLSAPSEATEWVDLTGERAYLHHIPISNDTRVTQREIYRSSYSEEDQPFRYAFAIPDNTTIEHFDDVDDDKLGETIEVRGVPSGTIKCPKGMIVDEFKDQIVIFQDPSVLKRMYHADPYYTYSWSELNARDLPSELVGGVVSFDNLYLFLRNARIYRIEDDLALGGLIPLGEMFKAVSPWGICKVEEDIAVLSAMSIKLFTGYQSTDIGEAIDPFLDPADYKVEEGLLFYHHDHLYYAVETRAGGSYTLLDCYVPTLKWEDRKLYANCFCVFSGQGDKNELVYGDYSGYIRYIGPDFAAVMTIRSKEYGEVNTAKGKGFLFHEKELQEIRVIAKGGDATSGYLTLKVYANGTDWGISRRIPSSGHLSTTYHTYVIQLTGVEKAVIGQALGFSLEHNLVDKNVFIKAVMLNGVVIPLEQQFTD